MGPELALIGEGTSLTHAEQADRVAAARAALAEAGVEAGSRVALTAENTVDTVVTIHALIEMGATLVPIHPRLTPGEAAVLHEDARPALVLRGPLLPSPLRPVPVPVPVPVPDSPLSSVPAPLAILYTSGTTGRPKGAVLSRRAFRAAAEASAVNLGWTPADRWLCCLPLCHIGGLSILTRSALARRPVILHRRFDPDGVLASIPREGATLLSVVPTMLRALLERDTGNALAGLRAMLVGGAATPFDLVEECARRGVPALTTYGLTEACSQVTSQPPRDPRRALRGSGLPLPGVEIRLREGRVQVRGPALMDGYFRGPDQPLDRPFDDEGFFDTGDLGERDPDGTLHVLARRTDLIVTGGENVYPLEIEQRLEAIPGVRRALVFGVADARWGQVVAAAVEMAEGVELSAVVAAAGAALAPHKRPRLACAVTALPLTGSGKLVRSGAVERFGEALRRVG